MAKKLSVNRVVVIGGFASNREVIEKIGRALVDELRLFDEFAAFTMYEAAARPDQLRRAAAGQTVVMHSAGALLTPQLKSLELKSAHFIAPPVPKTLADLPKQKRDFANSPLENDPCTYHDHMPYYYKQLPRICRADGLQLARELADAGVGVHVGVMNRDAYFALDDDYRRRIAKSGLDVVEITHGSRGAGHSAVQNFPAEILREYFAKIQAI